ncbi:MAG: ClbS/DfsB family four-helix bundle protein, partial [Anaerolineales bacterium]|nr:ClbS/DfsB family four-helix bundle protein [Anaerolineales bacterium]
MPKSTILKALDESRKQLVSTIEGLSDEDMQMPTLAGEWSVKDILVHLTMWEAEMVKLLWQASQGMKPNTAHFSIVPIDEINAEWFEANLARSLNRVMDDFHAVRKQTIRRLEDFTEDELDNPDR